ncbi:Ala-tRNA(Pro) hydrolase [Arboricoccus pini]|uniref:Ala-tRNA(Pro) hydrolase n=1 Tax=Arboricoccus pini TaxID=1963835 RepID=A0A212R8W2_9PROT|nr:prolyl-tRNA synthetase associated domain-containing protein [Arboricoccus pini]SNB68462.1 Ala-tRNA(Pro) hydrolase [Arboricoccus pini]
MLCDVSAMLAYLDELGIAARTQEHPPVFTVDEAALHTAHMAGGHTKNLFLEDKAGGFWLVTCLDRQVVKINGLSRLLNVPRFRFATPERLVEFLGVEPGSVSPLALVNDKDLRVKVVFDKKMLALAELNFHPLRNTATTTLATSDFLRFVAATGHDPMVVDLDLTLTS